MNPLTKLWLITRQMGLRYTLYRGYYTFLKRSRLIQLQFPVDMEQQEFINLEEWRMKAPLFFFKDRTDLPDALKKYKTDQKDVDMILDGKIRFFSGEWIDLGKDYDWVMNPLTGYKYRNDIHWSTINEFSLESGDIKYLWEKSRFNHFFPIIRNDLQSGTDHSGFIFSEIQSWINNNPVNKGPNYICSQEISIRMMNWTFALYFYRNSRALTPDLFQIIMHSIYWQIRHVYSNIHFSRYTVRNNHAMTETFLLFFAGLLFPFFPGSDKWRTKGGKWFELETDYQVYPDGTYLQFSMNYHRVGIQLFTWIISLSRIHHQPISRKVLENAYKSVDFLFQCQDSDSGMLPNYGANDGALFFPLSSCDYRDYRPQLNTLHRLLTGTDLYPEGPWLEESIWIRDRANEKPQFSPLLKQTGIIRFDTGGYYLIREEDTLTFIRCGKHRDRPSQADNLHLDIWYKGENLLMDTGSYRYNCQEEEWRFFVGTRGHNTVTVAGHDQMMHGGRFIWFDWSQAVAVEFAKTETHFVFQGSIRAFRHLGKPILHTRVFKKEIGKPVWFVQDTIDGVGSLPIEQHWHTLSLEKILITSRSGLSARKDKGWFSSTYGEKKPVTHIIFESDEGIIETELKVTCGSF